MFGLPSSLFTVGKSVVVQRIVTGVSPIHGARHARSGNEVPDLSLSKNPGPASGCRSCRHFRSARAPTVMMAWLAVAGPAMATCPLKAGSRGRPVPCAASFTTSRFTSKAARRSSRVQYPRRLHVVGDGAQASPCTGTGPGCLGVGTKGEADIDHVGSLRSLVVLVRLDGSISSPERRRD